MTTTTDILTVFGTAFGRVAKATGLSSLRDRAANLRCRLAALRINPSRDRAERERLSRLVDSILRQLTKEYEWARSKEVENPSTPVEHYREGYAEATCDSLNDIGKMIRRSARKAQ